MSEKKNGEIVEKGAASSAPLLIERVAPAMNLTVVEEAAAPGKTGKVRVRGEFARADIATENKRIYPRTLWEREITRLEKALENKQVFGELDHPSDGRTSLQRASHIVTGLQVQDDGIVVGEAIILDTEQGNNLRALLKAGCKVGVSSRGYGSTKKNQKDEDVVQEDYRLVTFDFVAEPADSHALPQAFFESKQAKALMEKGMTIEEIEAYRAEAREAAKKELRESFATELLTQIAKVKDEAKQEVRDELLADAAMAGPKAVIESLKNLLKPYLIPEEAQGEIKVRDEEIANLKKAIAESNLKIADLEVNLAKATDVAREVGYRFFIEQSLTGSADAELIKKLIGDVKQYENTDAIKTKIEAVRAELTAKAEEARKAAEEAQRQEEAAHAKERELEAKIAKLTEALHKAAEANKVVATRLYAEERLRSHPKAGQVRKLIESADPSTTDEVDEIIESFRETVSEAADLEDVRARVRAATRGGEGNKPLDEEVEQGRKGGKQVAENYNGLGVGLADLRELAGIKGARKS